MDISIHNATEVKLVKHFPGNANSVTLSIKSGGPLGNANAVETVTIYDLPESVTSKLIAAMADDQTRVVE